MSAADVQEARSPVSTAGAWLGLAIAARSALVVVGHMTALALAAGLPALLEWFSRQGDERAGGGEVPSQVADVFDLWFELGALLKPYVRVAGFSAVGIGLALFVASVAFLRGSEPGRRAVRFLLLAEGLRVVATQVWFVSLSSRLADWSERYAKAVEELRAILPHADPRFPPALQDPVWLQTAPSLVLSVASLALTALLWWLAGRPFAREWCAARAGLR